jgi:hypothetical protein
LRLKEGLPITPGLTHEQTSGDVWFHRNKEKIMLEVELDIFSGMPNPRWILTEKEEQELMARIAAEPTQVSPLNSADEQFSLGYRGMIVRTIKTDKPSGAGGEPQGAGIALPREYRLGSRVARDAAASAADWLLKTSEPSYKRSGLTDPLRELAAAGVVLVERSFIDPASFAPSSIEATPETRHYPTMSGDNPHGPGSGEVTAQGATWWACGSSYFSANISFFNDPAHVGLNNCYCFASNHMPDIRYARPGRRAGQPATALTCQAVIAGLYADGWRDGCQPNGLTIVLVIWPGYDYHFYRLVTGGPNWWWGHKPGGTPAKYTDDCGNAIYQSEGRGYAPNNICRGNYTDFCGYFYQNNNTAFVA